MSTTTTFLKPLQKLNPVIIICSSFGMVIYFLFNSIIDKCGMLTYCLDDAYIHLAIAKNLANHGIWGVTGYEFSSSSSSILWTILLTGWNILFGVNAYAPFIINLLFAMLLITFVHSIFKQNKKNWFHKVIFLSLFIFFTPLPSLVFSGMEHILQIIIALAVIYLSASVLENGSSCVEKKYWLLLLAPLATMARYEGLFLIFIVCILFIFRRNYRFGAVFGLLGILPIVLFGQIAAFNGWHFIPTSVLLKGDAPSFAHMFDILYSLGLNSIEKAYDAPEVFVLLLLILVSFIMEQKKTNNFWVKNQLMKVMYVVITLLHMQYAKFGWFYRYEAYLVALGIIILGVSYEIKPFRLSSMGKIQNLAAILLVIIILFPLLSRAARSLIDIPYAAENINRQQYQMASFIKKYYNNAVITANDIGAICFFTDIRLIDLAGLASIDVADAMRSKQFNKSFVTALSNKEKAEIAVIYESWYSGIIPNNWVKVGTWEIKNNVICGDSRVTFFSINPKNSTKLENNLKDYADNLPDDISQTGKYVSADLKY